MKLQFLVNHYNEPQYMVERLLKSIVMQNEVVPGEDYGVLICNDGAENALDSAFLNAFPFPMEYVILPHKGMCATRNALLDMATADYVMFCDADDCFSGPDGVRSLLNATNKGTVDAVSAPFEEEIKDGDSFRVRMIPKNLVWVHSKLFRRQFLMENNIRFPEESESAGDMTFIWHAFHMADNIGGVEGCYYTWKWNGDSLTRKLPYAGTRFYGSEVRAFATLTFKLISIQRKDLYQELIASLINEAYIYCFLKEWGSAPREYVDNAKLAIKEYVQKYAQYYEDIEETVRRRSYRRMLEARRFLIADQGFDGIKAWIAKQIRDEPS